MLGTYDWLIVGGGIQGTFFSNYLITRGYSSPERVAVLDPHAEMFKVWRQNAANTGMSFLRSPAEHNLDVGAGSIFKFASESGFGKDHFERRFSRPSLSLFNRHCDYVVEKRGLADIRLQGSAQSIVRKDLSKYVVETESGDLKSQRVILALGDSNNLQYPGWVTDQMISSGKVCHIFSPEFQVPVATELNRVAVIGGGITAVQTALKLANLNPGSVSLIHSKELVARELDFDPCWTRSVCTNKLRKLSDYGKRRELVRATRHRGTIPRRLRKELDRAIGSGVINLIEDTVVEATFSAAGQVELALRDQGNCNFDFLCLATGFGAGPPVGDLLDSVFHNLPVRMAPCGFPVPDKYLQITEGLFVSGSLAELEIGPAARNIHGARMAAEKIVASCFRPRTRAREENYYYFASRRNN